MSVRGQYYPNNKEVPAGDRKLYLQIESLTERGLQLAKAEVARLIKEEMMKMVSLETLILLITANSWIWILAKSCFTIGQSWSLQSAVVVWRCCWICESSRRLRRCFVKSNFVSLISFLFSVARLNIVHWSLKQKRWRQKASSTIYRKTSHLV